MQNEQIFKVCRRCGDEVQMTQEQVLCHECQEAIAIIAGEDHETQ